MLNARKDEKIQLYRKVVEVVEGTTREVNYRQFIYDKNTYDKGGLWANARTMTNTEAVNSGLDYDKFNVKFTVNNNHNLATDLKVIYRGEIYDITTIDELDFRNVDNTFTAVRTADTSVYAGDRFEE